MLEKGDVLAILSVEAFRDWLTLFKVWPIKDLDGKFLLHFLICLGLSSIKECRVISRSLLP